MRIAVQTIPDDSVDLTTSTAVVADVLRATTVMALALHCGASEIIALREIAEARLIAQTITPPPLLCGERHCQPIEGFDLGNSPQDYGPDIVAGRCLVMTTTNGTRALAAAKHADKVYAGSFVNLNAVASRLQHSDNVTIVCAGTDGEETEEDILFAGALIHRIGDWGIPLVLDNAAKLAQLDWQNFLDEGVPLAKRLYQSCGGRNLIDAGYLADIDFCAAIDFVTTVPQMVTRQPITMKRSLQ